jgi:hypothetical protein
MDKNFPFFLRPFYTMDKIYSTITTTTYIGTAGQSFTMVFQLEDTIVKAFRYEMPVVALGEPGETFGVGRILVDEDSWQKAASVLMRRASLIIFQPSSRPGSLWELDQIMLNCYLRKTVFITPPEATFFRWKQLREDWSVLKNHVISFGTTFPKYQSAGLLFSLDENGQCITEKLRLYSTSNFWRKLNG